MDKSKQIKEPFYVFTSIGGVLFDSNYVSNVHGFFADAIEKPVLKPSSVSALFYLVEQLEKTYNTKLILTSHYTNNMLDCMQYLNFNMALQNITYDKPIFAVKQGQNSRGEKVLDYIKSNGYYPKHKKNLNWIAEKILHKAKTEGDFKNYVVIDGGLNKINKEIPSENLIITDFDKESLTQKQVDSFLFNLAHKKSQETERNLV